MVRETQNGGLNFFIKKVKNGEIEGLECVDLGNHSDSWRS